MPSLSKTDEVDLLLRVLECSTQSGGWPRVLELIDSKLSCSSFLVEFTKDGIPTKRFGGDRSHQNLNGMLGLPAADRSRKALQFLLTEAPLLYPYCRTMLSKGEFNGNKPVIDPDMTVPASADAGTEEQLSGAHSFGPDLPGLASPLRRSENSTILFGCLFHGHTISSIDVALANETFRTLVKLISPGLETFFQIDQERANGQVHRTLLACTAGPAVLTTDERHVLAQTASGLDKLLATGGVSLRDDKLDFKNKRLETCLQGLLDEIRTGKQLTGISDQATDTADPEETEHSVFIEDASGGLQRISFGAVTPASGNGSFGQNAWIVIRMAEPTGLPEDVELVLQDQYQLSQSEAHLARYLTMTGSMTDTVEQLGITRNTAKTHMRRIFEKTGINTQLQLARLVHKLSDYF
jgi:DNA-binding CsgD family transcriptional regulator